MWVTRRPYKQHIITIPCKLISYGCLGRLSWASISCFVNLCLGKSISVSVLPGHIQLTRIPVSLMATFSSKVATKKEIFEGWTAQMDNGFSKQMTAWNKMIICSLEIVARQAGINQDYLFAEIYTYCSFCLCNFISISFTNSWFVNISQSHFCSHSVTYTLSTNKI